jgi:DNA-binding CsgD family transcriptional regulator
MGKSPHPGRRGSVAGPGAAAYRRGVINGPAAGSWGSAASALYGDLRLSPLLRQLLDHSTRLLGAAASSISLVEPAGDRYGKIAQTGVSCRLGQSFSLDEGATGQVVTRRRPLVLASYRDVAAGHLPELDPASTGAVVGVPIWWRGDVIGANVVFAGRSRRFRTAEVDELEVLTQLAAAGIVKAGANDPTLVHLLRDHTRRPEAADPADQPAAAPVPEEPSPLTAREQEVLTLLGRGLADREVAARLVISRKTVEKHVGAVLRKTGTGSRTAAVVHALDRGWLASDRAADPAAGPARDHPTAASGPA